MAVTVYLAGFGGPVMPTCGLLLPGRSNDVLRVPQGDASVQPQTRGAQPPPAERPRMEPRGAALQERKPSSPHPTGSHLAATRTLDESRFHRAPGSPCGSVCHRLAVTATNSSPRGRLTPSRRTIPGTSPPPPNVRAWSL